MKRLYVIKTGTTFPATSQHFGDFDAWTRTALGKVRTEVCVVDVEHGEPLPSRHDCAGVVITGSHAMVTDNLPWSVGVEGWIPRLLDAEVPIFGVCYGHQLLARALGGEVGYHPLGQEIGTVTVRILPDGKDDPLFEALPRHFPAHATHSQSVLRLPPGAVRLASNDYEPHHAFRVGSCAWGVQFHPEYDADIMRSYIDEQADRLISRGVDVQSLRAGVTETPESLQSIRKFAQLVDRQTFEA